MFEFLKHKIYGKPLLITAVLSPLLLSGCINEEGVCPDDISKSDGTWLSMRVVNADSQQGRTRADDAGHPDEAATDPENYIDGSDMSIMLLDNRQLVRHVFTPDEITVQQNGSEYNLRFRLNSDYFSYAGDAANVDFSLMVVANRTGLGGETSTFGTGMLSKTPLQIAQEYPSFTMPAQTDAAWMPNSSDKRIPMSGILKETVAAADLNKANTYDTPLNIGTITLQRNLCKVRILDDLNGLEGGSEYEKITSVKLVGANGKGAFIPVVAEGSDSWYNGTRVLETPTVQSGWWNATTEVAMKNAPQTSVVNNKDGNYNWSNAFYCYVPEAALTDRGAKLIIEASYKDNPGQPNKVWQLSLDQAGTGENAGYLGTTSFVRNHIYEYLVQAVSGAKLTLTLNVVDWESQTVEWDYSDNPGVADNGWLTWTDHIGAIVTITKNEETTIVLNDDQNIAATGTFQFSQPLGGTWTASFAPIGDTEADAFCFVNENGDLVNTISGPIDGKASSITIRPRYPRARLRQRSAYLIFTVRTPDGRTLSGDLVDGNVKHFTVIQNLNM